MNKLLASLALAATSVVFPAVASAAPSILTVDLETVLSTCTACKAAGATLQGQVTSGRSRAQQLETQWAAEEKSLQTAVTALNGKEPDAALKARITKYQTSRQQGQAELAAKESQLQSIQAHVQQQLGARVVQIGEQIRARRQADIVIGKNSTLASNPANDITAEVLSTLNQQLPAVSVTPMPQQSQPAGR